MRNLKTSDITTSVGMPIKSGTLQHIQSAYKEAIDSAVRSIVFGSLYDPNTGYILHGCVNSGAGNNFNISAGAVFVGGEVYQVDAATFTASSPNVAVGVITTTFFSGANADPVTFTDNTPRSVHEIRKIVFQEGLSGSGAFNFSDAVDLRYKPQGCIGQIIMWRPPFGNSNNFFDSTGLGNHPYTLGWAITNGENLTDNFSGRVPVAYAFNDPDFGIIGQASGAKTHTLTSAQQGTFTVAVFGDDGDGDVDTRISVEKIRFNGVEVPRNVSNWGSDVTVSLSTASQAHNNLQPYRVVLFIQRIQ